MRTSIVQLQANVWVQILRQLSFRSTVEQIFRQSLIRRRDLLRVIIANNTDQLDDIVAIFTFTHFSICVFIEVQRHA